jgi:hypothetical protein
VKLMYDALRNLISRNGFSQRNASSLAAPNRCILVAYLVPGDFLAYFNYTREAEEMQV